MKKIVFIWSLILLCSACSTTQKSSQKFEKTFPITALLETGNSTQVSVHPNGDRFLFVSSERFEHAHFQVYEYIFSQRQERRITFQDGQTAFPQYVGPKQIAYQSTTDQIKESLFRKPASTDPLDSSQAFEIYLSDFFGNSIERLTFNRGFDGNLRSFSKGSSRGISYLSQMGALQKLVLYREDKSWSPNIKVNFIEAQIAGHREAVVAIEKRNEEERLVVRNLKNSAIINEWPTERFRSFSLSADESKVFLIQAGLESPSVSVVTAYDLEKKCEIKWFEAPLKLEQIVEIPGQMNQFLVVFDEGGKSKIGIKEMLLPSCEKIVSK